MVAIEGATERRCSRVRVLRVSERNPFWLVRDIAERWVLLVRFGRVCLKVDSFGFDSWVDRVLAGLVRHNNDVCRLKTGVRTSSWFL